MKKVASIVLAAVMVLSLTGCGKAQTEGSVGTEKTEVKTEVVAPEPNPAEAEEGYEFTEPVTIKFANYAVLEAGYDKFWNEVKSGFEAKYPDIKIEYLTAEYGQMLTQVVTWAGGGEKVDMVFGEGTWVPTLADAGLATPVDQIFDADYLAGIQPSMLKATMYEGAPYAMPMYASPFIMFYNKALFEQAGLDPAAPPKTVEEMLAVAPKLAALKTADGNPVYPFGMTTASVAVSGSCLTSLVYGFGGQVLDDRGALSVDNEGFKQAYAFLKELDDKGYNPQVSKLKDLRNLFALGQLAMYYDTSWGFNGVRSINPDAASTIASAEPLAGGQGAGGSLIQSHAFIMMDNGEAQVEACKLLVDYILSEDVLAPYLSDIAPGYPSKIGMSNIQAITESPVLSGAAGALDTATGIAFIPTLADLNLELTALAQSVTVDDQDVNKAIEAFKSSAEGIVGN